MFWPIVPKIYHASADDKPVEVSPPEEGERASLQQQDRERPKSCHDAVGREGT